MICAKNSLFFRYSSQCGAALSVALILLLIMSILGIYGIRTTVLEEKMTAASYDRSLAFQAAEAALREGEAVAQAQAATGNDGFPNGGLFLGDPDEYRPHYAISGPPQCDGSPCNSGLCAQPDLNCAHRWLDPNFNGWVNAANVSPLAGTPQYFVEYLGNTFPCNPADINSARSCSRYRITARSNPGPGRTAVMLQSIYMTESIYLPD